ncbi:SCO7613 C-terminal domain-containing membrane protein [Nocardioides terrigena]|uniref:SCO7613 C-terminal domain-containing membrane protein n=1 Tax=Nocardioides terrigena TaxID=424797 RepID=UPI00131ED37D|nr:hypothetical protein [Nocardioides terrigena]
MFTYADPRACPGCRAPLTAPVLSCAACGLSLTGSAPRQVFEALRHVDGLVAAMYAQVPTPAAAHDAPVAATDVAAPPRPAPAPSYARTGLSAASVPRILLGLGALCLVVAAVVFLAVAWAALGVGGRTTVLVVLTAVAAGLMAWLAARDLRAGAEAFASVALGLLALDLGGAWRAGWLGPLGDEPFVVLAGLVVAGTAAAVGRWTATTPVGALVSAQAVGVVAVLVASLGVPGTIERGDAVGVLGALLVCVAGAALGHLVGLRVLALGAAVGAVGWWVALVVVGVGRLDELTVAGVWGELAVWPLLVATALAAVVALPRRLPTEARVGAASVAVLLGTAVVTVVSFDESATRVALVELAVVAAYAVLSARLTGAWRWVCAAPSVVAALGLAASVLMLVGAALPVLVLHDPWSVGVLTRLDAPDVPWSWPLLLPVGVAGIAVAASTVLRCAGLRAGSALVPGTALALVALALVPPLYAAPLLVAVVVLLLVGGALAVGGAVLDRVEVLALAAVTLLLALGAALASDWVTAGTLAVLTAAAVALEVVPPRTWRDVGAALAPLTGAGLLWTLGHLAGVPVEARALPVLLVLGVAIVLVPRVGREVASAVAAACAVAASVVSAGPAGSVDQTWLAVHLTVAGVVATVSSLVNADRRRLAWVGLGLLTLAQWVRLQQVGVETVEAYTLPLALVLLVVGVVSMRRGNDSSVRALGPGLTLGLVPTLLLVLVDPVDLRAVLLGLACLVLVAVGVSQRWSAPLVAGAVTGALVVLREGTFAQVLPQWVLIGLVGVLLTVVGVTWEQRLRELQRVSAYVRGLR